MSERQRNGGAQLLADDAAMHTIATMEEHSRTTAELVRELHDWIERAQEPADYHILEATATKPSQTLNTKGHVPSLGVINPSPINIYVGIGGARATAAGRGFPVPSNAGVVLPVSVEDPEIGVDPADVGGLAGATAVFFVLQFETVQLFHLWRF